MFVRLVSCISAAIRFSLSKKHLDDTSLSVDYRSVFNNYTFQIETQQGRSG